MDDKFESFRSCFHPTLGRSVVSGASEAIHSYVGRVRPTAFLLIYVAIIAVFALIYCVLPGEQFYAQYAKMEPPALADAQNVAENIRSAINNSYRDHQSMAGDWQIAGGDVRVVGIEINDARELSFTVAFSASLTQQGKERASIGGPQFKATLDPLTLMTTYREKRLICHLITLPADRNIADFQEFNRHMLFRSPDGAIQADMLCWGDAQEETLLRLIDGWHGDPIGSAAPIGGWPISAR